MKVIEVVIEGLTVEEREAVNALLGQESYEGFWQEGNLFKAYINENNFNPSTLSKILNQIVDQPKFNYGYLEEKNWNEEWESNFKPVLVNDQLLIRAPFHNKADIHLKEIIIEPQMSFGTGHHNTTSLMAGYLLSLDIKDKKVLDMGCGTGVLAILAAQKGAGKVTAIDIEENACENTQHNMKLNGVDNIEVIHGDVLSIPETQYDLILANINKNILKKNMSIFANHMTERAKLLLSGFFSTDEEEILESTSENSLYLLDISRKDEWSMITVEKKTK